METKVTIKRYNITGKWLELWLDGLEYHENELIWDEEKKVFIATENKRWNYSCKLGRFTHEYYEQTENTISFENDFESIIGLTFHLDVENDIFYFNKQQTRLEEIRNKVAQEIGYISYNRYLTELIDNAETYLVERIIKLSDEVAERYARECCKTLSIN